jgi:hypothetical protein
MANDPSLTDPSLDFPDGTCEGAVGPIWQKDGTSWRPTGLTESDLTGPCVTPIHFRNGTRNIIVQPPFANEPFFQALTHEFPNAQVVDGLSADDTAALLSKFGEKVVNPVSLTPLAFTLPTVPRENARLGVDITPPLSPKLKAAIFDESK